MSHLPSPTKQKILSFVVLQKLKNNIYIAPTALGAPYTHKIHEHVKTSDKLIIIWSNLAS